jgi:hypothetical protein
MGARDSGLLLPVDKLATKAILEKKVEKEFLGFGGGVGRYRCRSIVGSNGENLRGVKARHIETGVVGGRKEKRVVSRCDISRNRNPINCCTKK